ncbi:nitrous oxide-stimulated promoter family protein [Treponema sp.]|uniref:nitrous oxide-stimulated promoter family protein n=1 Tax=Treponema sp. TaxID=166 RepID=UPI0025F5EB9E|nr:nitrous oxide-stimulated promoter family protein [Treponema sp.]MCR5217413.1 nitrous oxide-stimulated promoter family protein [Treponema sp.]
MTEEEKIIKKRIKEQKVVHLMIKLYCHKKHGSLKNELCPECRTLDEYAAQRSQHCPFMKTKTFCSNCKVHCYKPEMREKIRLVMRFSGPRMIYCHPLLAVWHLITSGLPKNTGRK